MDRPRPRSAGGATPGNHHLAAEDLSMTRRSIILLTMLAWPLGARATINDDAFSIDEIVFRQ